MHIICLNTTTSTAVHIWQSTTYKTC